MAVDFALAAICTDTDFLAGGTVIGGPVTHGGGGTTTGCEADAAGFNGLMIALSTPGICLVGKWLR